MRILILAAMLTAGMIVTIGDAMASEVIVSTNNPVVDISVNESVMAKPDCATFSTGVETLAPTANAAIRQNAEKMSAIVAKLKKLGIADKDIQTTQIGLSQSFDYSNSNSQPVFKGFQASNMVMVKLRDLKKLGSFLDALASDGATNFAGPNFQVDDNTKLTEQAREKAWTSAQVKGLAYAKRAGYTNIRVLKVSEGTGAYRYEYNAPAADASASATKSSADTPIAPGEIGVSVALSVVYEMIK